VHHQGVGRSAHDVPESGAPGRNPLPLATGSGIVF